MQEVFLGNLQLGKLRDCLVYIFKRPIILDFKVQNREAVVDVGQCNTDFM